VLDDARDALRGFRKTPVFTAVAILTLTLAIGANTALFSLLDALVLRDLPVRDPASLVLLRTVTATNPDGAFSLPMFRKIAARQRSFAAVIGWLSGVLNVEIDREEKRAAFATVIGNYFSELGVRPVVGRLLSDADDDLARLLVRSLQEIRAVPSGMQSDDVFVAYPGPRAGGYATGENDVYYQQVIQRLLAVPGVERASISLAISRAATCSPRTCLRCRTPTPTPRASSSAAGTCRASTSSAASSRSAASSSETPRRSPTSRAARCCRSG